ncbi:MAG: hypothetical protein K5695_14910 [Oscillospiraceae bacterium]|nr:hypothetical protein [Oscillospiraceae bacterium]
MHRKRNQNRINAPISGESIPELLHAAKIVLSVRQYKELTASVNDAVGYAEKKRRILAAIHQKKKEGCLE